ncbi:MAG: indolepyruvate oxidoreductase subunit beta [Syntrophaceae bacterium PtaB.Bin038]|nr:MAG: indolepyruvate oxidoreductase subunit beta [Syntrophaceae bacterium PtaB.Bin038]
MNNRVKSLLLAGVGGQGILLASDIICKVMMEKGCDVKKSEVHGMAQRGGCVTSHVRYGSKVFSPLARKGDVDMIVSFEKLEALRYLDYLKPGGLVIVNDEEIYPPSVNLGEADYPEGIFETLRARFGEQNVKVVAGPELAAKAGNRRAVNTVMLGTISRFIPEIAEADWKKVLASSLPEKIVEANLKAFDLGRAA